MSSTGLESSENPKVPSASHMQPRARHTDKRAGGRAEASAGDGDAETHCVHGRDAAR